MTVYDVVVVGGGNLELWTAHRLARRGFGRIAVLERSWAGGGATSRSAGVVCQQGGSETAAKLGRLSRELYLQLGEELGLGEAWAITEPEAGSDIKTTARRDGDGWVLNGEKWFVTGGEVRLNGRG